MRNYGSGMPALQRSKHRSGEPRKRNDPPGLYFGGPFRVVFSNSSMRQVIE